MICHSCEAMLSKNKLSELLILTFCAFWQPFDGIQIWRPATQACVNTQFPHVFVFVYTKFKSNIPLLEQRYKKSYFLPPPQNQPLTRPVIPPPFFCSILSSSDGISTWFKARSKNNGLHGIGSKSGGNVIIFGFFPVKPLSSMYWSNLWESGWKIRTTCQA